MKPSIFKDLETQARFNRDGYVVIDFITPGQAKSIAEIFYREHPIIPRGFYSDAVNPDDTLKQEIFEHNEKIFEKVIADNFCDFKKLGSTFLCKAPGQESRVGVHQDWTVVDESKYYTATIWIPTIDVDEQNGALRIIPGSHLFYDAYRSNSIEVSYRGNEDLLWQNMITVPMKAGQAFVLNHATIHGSSPNLSDKERLVITYALAPQSAPLLYYYKNKLKGGRVEKFNMPDDFFQRYYNVGERPLFGEVVDEFDYPVPAASTEKITRLLELVKASGRDYNEDVVAKFNRSFVEPQTPGNLNPITDKSDISRMDKVNEDVWIDERSFFEKYTPANILAEIKNMLKAS